MLYDLEYMYNKNHMNYYGVVIFEVPCEKQVLSFTVSRASTKEKYLKSLLQIFLVWLLVSENQIIIASDSIKSLQVLLNNHIDKFLQIC